MKTDFINNFNVPPLKTKWEYANRRPLILKARREGQTLAAIGNTWGITGERVRQIIKEEQTTPKTFKCVRCAVEVEALPTGMEDIMGGTHYVYTTPPGWWSITTETGMVTFCAGEDVGIVTAEIIDAMDNMEVQPCRSETM